MLWLSIARLMTEFKLHIFTGRLGNLLGSKKLVHQSQDGRATLTSGLRAYPNDSKFN